MIIGWHFVNETLRDGSPVPPDGETLKFNGAIELCARGYHASERIIDALKYAPGNTICRVRCCGDMIRDSDKFVCSERRILWRVDGESILREFARRQALTVAHLWEMPDVTRQYLETGDESILIAARAAIGDATRTSARLAAYHATRFVAWNAAQSANWNAIRAAVYITPTVAGTPQRNIALDSARDAANETLAAMVNEAHNG